MSICLVKIRVHAGDTVLVKGKGWPQAVLSYTEDAVRIMDPSGSVTEVSADECELCKYAPNVYEYKSGERPLLGHLVLYTPSDYPVPEENKHSEEYIRKQAMVITDIIGDGNTVRTLDYHYNYRFLNTVDLEHIYDVNKSDRYRNSNLPVNVGDKVRWYSMNGVYPGLQASYAATVKGPSSSEDNLNMSVLLSVDGFDWVKPVRCLDLLSKYTDTDVVGQ